MGLREQKKLLTRRAIHETALALFLERGFDAVSVAEVAAAAQVSKMTVFNYFPTKEDLVLAPMEEQLNSDAAEILGGRRPGEPVVAAFRRAFLERLERRSADTGLDDRPAVQELMYLIRRTPSLMARLYMIQVFAEERLARLMEAESPGDPRAGIAAGQLTALWRRLQVTNTRRLVDGEPADEIYPDAVTTANAGFDLLESGFGAYLTRAAP
ncbi:TetR family transcriptional regulator [Acrocarpospora corrugata]|uniref:TetR family transcriptional regulator n=1 Tax=Acrocarpospora corrugata TaxID=35763 RepID=A0A5M3W1R3_9ACTN|nr:TetR family transcriptional regulator [Acrocarpospora corrugata]GES02674.1 TetR family transcriptional regulator [Acrocarpospora corrugata]